ncbi:MAG: sigma factor-like helix-turn-helix DNA-binding protein [Pseudomonadota bacterium]
MKDKSETSQQSLNADATNRGSSTGSAVSEERAHVETIVRLEIGLRRMPRLRREIFLALRLDDMSYVEIAERTGLSVKQVERHVSRSMLTLLNAVEGRGPIPWWKRLLRRPAAKLRR